MGGGGISPPPYVRGLTESYRVIEGSSYQESTVFVSSEL